MIYCPKCGNKIEPDKGNLDGHEIDDMTKESGYNFSADIVCFTDPEKIFSVTEMDKEHG